MGRTKKAGRGKPQKVPAPVASTSAPEPVPATPEELLHQAAAFIASQEYDAAKAVSAQAYERAVAAEDARLVTDSLEILGTVELELGELDAAREHFIMSVQHAAALPNPSPAPHLYLAQLSTPEESLVHFANALAILQAKINVIEKAKLGLDGGAGSEADIEEEGELRRSASRALVGMTELYLTDLCMDPEAEQNCEKHLASAAAVDPSDPEVYQTLASVRLSQQRPEDAKEAAMKGWSFWRKLGPDSVDYPVASTRLTLAKLFLELTLHVPALEILQRLENEDDEDPEVWYLSGWAWWLLGETRGDASTAEEESKSECWSESRLCLENYLRLDERDPSGSDPEQLAHLKDLLSKLDAAGVVASTGHQEGDDQWEDESEGEGEEEFYTVERIVSWEVRIVDNAPDDPGRDPCYDPTLGANKHQVRYLVKWKYYLDDAYDTWEPKENFMEWTDEYTQQIKELLKSNPEWRDPAVLQKEVDETNEKKRRNRAKKLKAVEDRKRSRSIVSHGGPSDLAKELADLVPDTPPKRDENGRLLSASEDERGSEDGKEEESEEEVVRPGRRASKGKGKAKVEAEEQPKKRRGRPRRNPVEKKPRLSMEPSTTTARMDEDLGYADDTDKEEEETPVEQPKTNVTSGHMVGSVGMEVEGFADEDSEDEEQSAPAHSPPPPSPNPPAPVATHQSSDSEDIPLRRAKPQTTTVVKRRGVVADSESESDQEPALNAPRQRRKRRWGPSPVVSPNHSASPPASQSQPTRNPLASKLSALGRIPRHSDLAKASQAQVPTPAPTPISATSSIARDAAPTFRPPPPSPLPSPVPPSPIIPSVLPSKSTDPRKRPSLSVPTPSSAPAEIVAVPVERAVFTSGPIKPTMSNGCHHLNVDVLRTKVGQMEFLQGPKFSRDATVDEKVRRLYGIGDMIENSRDFDERVRGKTCWIYAPAKENKLSKAGREVEEEVMAIQLVLAGLGVKQSAELTDEVAVVLVHVSEEAEVGKFLGKGEEEGPLVKLEKMREASLAERMFLLFGKKEKERVFRQFWSVHAAITISPSAFVEDHDLARAILVQAHQSTKLFPGRRDKFAWIPSTFVTSEGPFHLPPKRQVGRQDLETHPELQALLALHDLLRAETVTLAQPLPMRPPYTGFSFPQVGDDCLYREHCLRSLEAWLLPSLKRTDVESILDRCTVWKSRYSQVRRWIVIVTASEKQMCLPVPGVELFTLEEAQAFVSS
ncbi:TPR domain containing protein [Pseudohyphozyma bogoriensis]|nr:TPR domain containing protein [Pseudohyphozyma bogoriensis]